MAKPALPKRPRSHALESESRLAFERALPASWIVRPENLDYGADLSVEIVHDTTVTGRRFFVQLKATDEPDLAKALQLKIKQSAFRYLQKLNAPALLALYHSRTKRIIARWVHDLDVFYAGRSASYFTFRLAESDTLAPAMIPAALDDWFWIKSPTLDGPLTLELSFRSATVRGSPATDVAREIRSLAAPLRPTIEILSAPESKTRGHITLTEDDVTVRFLGGGGSGIHRSLAEARRRDFRRKPKPKPKKSATTTATPASESAGDVLTALALALAHANHRALAANVAELTFESATLRHHLPVPATLLTLLLDQDRHATIVRTAISLVRAGHPELGDLTVGAIFVTKSPHTLQETIAALEDWLAAVTPLYTEPLLAAAHYNVAHYIGHTRWDLRRSIVLYARAAQLDPSYRDRAYFWRDIAADLFHLDRFLWSARAYDRAAQLGADTRAHQADALWRIGRYDEALAALQQYKGDDPHWRATRIVLPHIIELAGTGHQHRDPAAALTHIERALSVKDDPAASETAYLAALAADAMSGDAWYNLGHTLVEAGRHLDAATAFLTTGLINNWDVTAWANAIAASRIAYSATDVSDDDRTIAGGLLWYSLAVAVPLHRDELFEMLVQQVGPDVPDVRGYVKSLFSTVPAAKEIPPVIRMFINGQMLELPADDPEKAFERLSQLAEKSR